MFVLFHKISHVCLWCVCWGWGGGGGWGVMLLKVEYLLQERSRLPAPGDADELSVIEGQIAWMVHIIAAILKLRQTVGVR